LILFTPEFEQTTRTDASGVEVIVRSGQVERAIENAGNTPIPSDGFVLSATGSAAQWVRARMAPRDRVSVTVGLMPLDRLRNSPWSTAEDVLGAGPMLVANGRVNITAKREKMRRGFDTERHPRTAIASLADGRVMLVTVDGRQPTRSVGMSLDELAHLLLEFGAIEAMNFDGGGSTTMVVEEVVVNHPSDPTGERPVSDAIVVVPKQP